jgi:ubiquinone/menaquinone biosynthesis C-methylase UbiE
MEPAGVLKEMARVCGRGGRVVVADVFVTSAAQGEAYDRMEKRRDPSHVRAMGLDELAEAFAGAGLRVSRREFYRFSADVDRLLAATCTPHAQAEEVRKTIAEDIGKDVLGISAHREEGKLRMSFPVVILAGSEI